MVYQRVTKPSSLSSLHKKESSETAAKIPLQAKSDSASPQEQEMPSYTPLAANWVTNNNLMRSLSQTQVVQRQEELNEEEIEPIQAKLTIGQVGDKYEQEADQTAQQVVNQINAPAPQQSTQSPALQREEMPEEELQMKSASGILQREEMPQEDEELQMKSASGAIQRETLLEEDELQMKPASGTIQRETLLEEDELQMKSDGGERDATPDLEASIQQAKGGGQPLADNIRQPMEKAFGADFSGVNVHTDAKSNQLNQSIQAKAFTTGQDVFFRQGAYDPSSRGGQELLAHELTHVVQQNPGKVAQPKADGGVIQRVSVKELTAKSEESRRKQQAQKFKNPTKKTLEKFFETQLEERKTDPKKLQQDQNTKQMLEQHLTEKLESKSKSDISTNSQVNETQKDAQLIEEMQPLDEETMRRFKDQVVSLAKQLDEIKEDFDIKRGKIDEKRELFRDQLIQLMGQEKLVRKSLKKEIDLRLARFQMLGGLEAMQNNEDEQAEINTVAAQVPDLNNLYSYLSKKRIEAKVLILGDNRNITSKKEGAKYQNLLKLKKSYRIDESKQLRVEGHDQRGEDEKTVRYLTPEQREKSKIKAVKQGEETIYVDENNQPVDSSKATQTQSSTGGMDGIFIFVMSEDGELHVADEGKESQGNEKFHHSSFLGGKPVAAAGEIRFSSGKVTEISNASGHYQPDLSYTYQALLELSSQGMSLSGITVTLVVGIDFTLRNTKGSPTTFSSGGSETVQLKADTFMAFCDSKAVGKKGKSNVTILELLTMLNGTDKWW